MYDHEEHIRSSERKSAEEEDGFGVCWGAELLDGEEGVESKKNSMRHYSSFYLHGRKYGLDDTVYLLSGDRNGPPYIGRIGKLCENIKDKEKQMHVRWFCRPCEMPEGLPGVDYSEKCKEVFVMWGDGARNINNPASTLRHCSVLCTAREEWNQNVPSFEEVAAADHVFDRAYDLRTGKLRSLDSIVRHYGEHIVTGTGRGTRAPGEFNKVTAGTRRALDYQPLPLAMRASSDLPTIELDWRRSGLPDPPASVAAPNTFSTPVEGHAESLVPKFSASALKTASHDSNKVGSPDSKAKEDKMIPKASKQGIKRKLVKVVKIAATLDLQKKPRVDKSNSSLPQQARVRLVDGDLPSSGLSHGKNESPIDNTGAGSHGNVALNRDRQKAVLNVAPKQMASEDKKRCKSNSPDQMTEKGKFKEPKLSIPFRAPGVAPAKGVTKVDSDFSLSTATCPKMGEMASEDKKRSRANSPDQITGKGKLKEPKLSIPFRAPGVALAKGFSKVENDFSLSTATCPKMGEMGSPKVPERNLLENSSGWHQARQSPSIKNQDGRVSSAPVAGRSLAKEENLSNRDQMGNQIQVSPSARPVKAENAGFHSPKVVEKRSTKLSGKSLSEQKREAIHHAKKESVKEESAGLSEPKREERRCLKKQPVKEENTNVSPSSRRLAPTCSRDASCRQQDPEDVSSRHQNGAILKSTDLEQDTKLSGKSTAHGLERRYQPDMQDNVSEVKISLPNGPNALTSNRVGSDGDVSPTSNKSRHLSEGNWDGKTESRAKYVSVVSSKTSGLVRKDAKTHVKKQRVSEHGLAAQSDSRPAGLDTTAAPSEEKERAAFEPKKKIFNFPWEDTLRIALEQGKALFLQNLDPWFSSAEIEADLQELLRVSCDVRMLPPKNFTCYTSGQALVLFPSHVAAKEALQKLTENLLIWSKDERPVLASLPDAKIAIGNRIHGFYNTGSRGLHPVGEGQKNAVATSHCSQPNTVEYEMGIQWRLLQDRHTEAWTIAAEDERAAMDHRDQGSKPRCL